MKNTPYITTFSSEDKPQWEVLYRGYAEFYQMPMLQQTLDTVWDWIHDSNQEIFALSARLADERGQDKIVGLMHFRAMPSPLKGQWVGFLDDLFVLPAARKRGVAKALFASLREEAVNRGWAHVRWITAEKNYQARSLYDSLGDKTHWVTYQIPAIQS